MRGHGPRGPSRSYAYDHGCSKIVEIALVAAEPTRKWSHTVKICLQPKQYMFYNFSNGSKNYRFL